MNEREDREMPREYTVDLHRRDEIKDDVLQETYDHVIHYTVGPVGELRLSGDSKAIVFAPGIWIYFIARLEE